VVGPSKTFILRHFLNRARSNLLYQQLVNKCSELCRVNTMNTGESIFRIMGPVAAVEQGKIESAELLRAMESDIECCKVPLDAGQAQFLQDTADGKRVMRKLTTKGVWWDFSNLPSSKLLAHCRLPNGCEVEVRHGDAVKGGLGIAAIVNSANGQLLVGEVAGIAGAIKLKGGPALTDECSQLLAGRLGDDIHKGEVVTTGAHGLEAAGFANVLHAVPPMYSQRTEAGQQMEATVSAILAEASRLGINSVVMPVLGAGIFGWGRPPYAVIGHILKAIAAFGTSTDTSPQRVVVMDMDFSIAQHGHGLLNRPAVRPTNSGFRRPR